VRVAWDVIRRFSMLALTLGRRAILPSLPCALAPCATRVPTPLRSVIVGLSCGESAMCEDGRLPHAQSTPWSDLLPRPFEAPLEWDAQTNTSAWWWQPAAEPRRRSPGCCQLVPVINSCVDASGARRTLSEEPMLCAADLGRLLEEGRRRRADGEEGSAGLPPLISRYALGSNWSDTSLKGPAQLTTRPLRTHQA